MPGGVNAIGSAGTYMRCPFFSESLQPKVQLKIGTTAMSPGGVKVVAVSFSLFNVFFFNHKQASVH